MKLSKILLVLMAVMLLAAGCASQTAEEETAPAVEATAEATAEPTAEPTEEPAVEADPIKIATLAGPTGMGLIQLIDDTSGKYETSIFYST